MSGIYCLVFSISFNPVSFRRSFMHVCLFYFSFCFSGVLLYLMLDSHMLVSLDKWITHTSEGCPAPLLGWKWGP